MSTVHRTLQILEVVAARGGASAKEIADDTGLPLPTVYRLARELLDSDYLVHIREEKRFELGYKLHQLGVSLHQQIGVSREVRAEITALHHQLGTAAYFAVHRGSQIAVVVTADSPQCPRLRPPEFGKILLGHRELTDQLDRGADRGVAWELGELGELRDGATCAAAAVRGASGVLIGSVAVSGPGARFSSGRDEVEAALRGTASRVSRFYRSGSTR